MSDTTNNGFDNPTNGQQNVTRPSAEPQPPQTDAHNDQTQPTVPFTQNSASAGLNSSEQASFGQSAPRQSVPGQAMPAQPPSTQSPFSWQTPLPGQSVYGQQSASGQSTSGQPSYPNQPAPNSSISNQSAPGQTPPLGQAGQAAPGQFTSAPPVFDQTAPSQPSSGQYPYTTPTTPAAPVPPTSSSAPSGQPTYSSPFSQSGQSVPQYGSAQAGGPSQATQPTQPTEPFRQTAAFGGGSPSEQPVSPTPAPSPATTGVAPTLPLPSQEVQPTRPRYGELAPQSLPTPSTSPYSQNSQLSGQQSSHLSSLSDSGVQSRYPQQQYGQAPTFFSSGGQQNPSGSQGGAGEPPSSSNTSQYDAFGQPTDKKKPGGARRGLTVGLVIAGLVVGGIAGGAVGGVVANASSNSNAVQVASTSTGSGNITVNDTSSVSQITAVAASASPSVVTINTTSSSASEAGTGSGVILSADGYILTNTHVVTLDGEVANASLQVVTNDGKIYTAKLIGTDPTDDLAVIKIDASGLKPITFADSSKLNVGQQVVAIGAPLQLSGTVTQGIISALDRSIAIASSAAPTGGDSSDGSSSGSNPFSFPGFGSSSAPTATATINLPVIQTDAPINPGNSGGALLNSSGQLIGVNVAIASADSSSTSSDSQSGSIGIGFAITSDVAKRIADEIIANGKATHGLLGVYDEDATDSSNATTLGAVITKVVSAEAASKAGLQVGDLITSFNGVPIQSATDLAAQVASSAAGSAASVEYVRNGKTYQVTVTLGTMSTTS